MKPYFLFIVIALSIVYVSCKKDPPVKPTETEDLTDTTTQHFLEQDIYSVTTNGKASPGEILVAPFPISNLFTGSLMIFNEEGKLLKIKETDGAAFCFRKWKINGQTRYTYLINDKNTYHIRDINQVTGYAVIADTGLNEIKRIHLMPHDDIITGPHIPDLDVHDMILLSDDHYFVASYYPKIVNNIPDSLAQAYLPKVVATVIQEIRNGSVVWQWDSSDYPEFYSTSIEGNLFYDRFIFQDYMHFNSMILDPRDNNLICSFRNLDQVIKINTTTGDVMWRLGGINSDFPMANHQYFLRQHDATLVDDNQTLLLFDNGHPSIRNKSRVLEIKIDEASKTITAFKSFDIPEEISNFMGSVQKIGQNYFIGGGSRNFVLEINSITGERILDMKSPQTTYRAYKYPDNEDI